MWQISRPVAAHERTDSHLDPLASWTIHDLRRTTASGLGRLGASRFIISRVLNHA
jgi:hypothetical protein